MTSTDEGCRSVDRFASARLTVLQHTGGGTCLNCGDNGCKQQSWAVEELDGHAGGRELLNRLGLLSPADIYPTGGQPR
ncbi:hypothetical protein [Micromonospora sp. NPDC049662]|uniref:hypothetical protein n=1 Tax=Micromonospora sp. NPDC049662 TaxID=3155397 RepID=UPI0034367BDE